MRNVYNLILAIVISCIFCVVPVMKLLQVAGIVSPNRMGSNQSFFELEGRKARTAPILTVHGLADKSFQQKSEQYVADVVPVREEALLLNALLQRRVIEFANLPFNWEAYPTFYSSGYIVVPEHSALLRTTLQPTSRDEDAVKKWVNNINATKEEFPNVRFVYDLMNDPFTTEFNPSWSLVSNHYTNDWIEKHIASPLNKDIILIWDPIESERELYEDWYLTEQHWKLPRALDSYNRIGKELDWQRFAYTDDQMIEDSWYGAYARSGLDLAYSDSLYDMPVDFSSLICKVNGKTADRGARAAVLDGRPPAYSEPVFNYYHKYYGNPAGEVVYENSSNPNGKKCLFVEQSYGVLIEPYVACNYSVTVCVDPLNAKAEKSIADYIRQYDIDEVVFQFAFGRIEKGVANSPKYFSE